MPKSKKFIDKKSSVTFHLVHRSQQDPLVADEAAPQRVLVPIHDHKDSKDKSERLVAQQKYGIFFDDDYNYLQHFRDTNKLTEWQRVEPAQKDSKIQLPSSVFASSVEEEVGLLNKAAPSGLRLDVDLDVVAAMEDDYNFDDPDNELEDNFIELANAGNEDLDEEEMDDEDLDEEEMDDEVCSLDESQWGEETKSQFTSYSTSSRNQNLALLDDRFEKMYLDYDESEIGALDCEEIEGHIDEGSDLIKTYVNEFNKNKSARILPDKWHSHDYDSETDNLDLVELRVPEKEKWDCESILTTRSNLYNHPKLITETKIKVDRKTGIPKNVLNSSKLTVEALLALDRQQIYADDDAKSITASVVSALSIRNKGESLEEKRTRKRLLKEYRRERREEKKMNDAAFKHENIRQAKIAINAKNNVQGNKIF